MMDPELKSLLVMLAFVVPAGVVVGVVIRKKFPESSKTYSKWCLDARWKMFSFGLVLFAALSLLMFWDDKPYLGWYFAAFGALQLWSLIAYGFKPLDDATRNAIDSSDPTKLLPIRFWKKGD